MDHTLIFRVYSATLDFEGSLELFRELRERMSTLMFNLVLRTCVQAKQPQLAYDVTQEMRGYENEQQRVVDAVSYNTLIKGFAEAAQPERCFDILKEMRQAGIEPDDVTLGSLLDVCIGENDMDQAHKVMDSLLSG